MIITYTSFCSDWMTAMAVIGNYYTFSLGNVNNLFPLEPLVHLE